MSTASRVRAACASPQHRQRGAAVIEFALVAIIFFMLMLGIMDFGRWLFTLNAASEATRLGARVAVVCDIDEPSIKDRMRQMLPTLTDQQIQVNYFATDSANASNWVSGCTVGTCAGVQVQLSGVTMPAIAWFLPAGIPIPAFPTSLTRESLRSAIDGSANPVCQ